MILDSPFFDSLKSVKRRLSGPSLSENVRPFLDHPKVVSLAELSTRFDSKEIAIVVGNGPSFNLKQIKEIPHTGLFVCNYAHKIDGLIEMEPDMWLVGDPVETISLELIQAMSRAPLSTLLVLNGSKNPAPGNLFGNREILQVTCRLRLLNLWGNPKRSASLRKIRTPRHLYTFRHTPMLSIQLALLAGYKSVILLGLDHDHVVSQITDPSLQVKHSYHEASREIEVMPRRTYLHLAHEIRLTWGEYAALGNLARKMGAEILDATPGGHLDVFTKLV